MSKSGMRWGDSCSSDEDEIRVRVPARHESSSSDYDSDDVGGNASRVPPTRFVSTSGGGGGPTSSLQNRKLGRQRSDDKSEFKGGGRSGRGGGRQGRGQNRGGAGGKKGSKGSGRKGGKLTQASVSIGASEWKSLAKEAKKYGKETFGKYNIHCMKLLLSIFFLE